MTHQADSAPTDRFSGLRAPVAPWRLTMYGVIITVGIALYYFLGSGEQDTRALLMASVGSLILIGTYFFETRVLTRRGTGRGTSEAP